jgi:predicted metal-dependent HD superfamily phosphohydrolase
MFTTQLLQQAEIFVTTLFETADTRLLYFHNLDHTREVVRHARSIGQKDHLSQDDWNLLQVAAWFHDTGHLNGPAAGHEERSAALAKSFFKECGFQDEPSIQKVTDMIMATQMPHHPNDRLGAIICDADLYHFGTPDFKKTNRLVRREFEARGVELPQDWLLATLRLLQSHEFLIEFVREKLEPGKEENIRWLQKKIDELRLRTAAFQSSFSTANARRVEKEAQREEKQAQKIDEGMLSRGMQTVLRLGSGNHLELSRLADGKANILISVNSIIISIILSVLVGRLDSRPHLVIPTVLFLGSSVITVIFAILATRPKLTKGTFTRENIRDKQTNLLFFGNFYKSSLEDYTWAMNELMKDKDYMYDTLIKDIYFLGIVLGKKYQLLRLAYNIFMVGLVVAVVAYSVAFIAAGYHR